MRFLRNWAYLTLLRVTVKLMLRKENEDVSQKGNEHDIFCRIFFQSMLFFNRELRETYDILNTRKLMVI